MKKIKVIPLFISLAFIVSPLLYAAPVTIETAKQVAMNLFLERYDGNVENMVIFETFTEKENSENIYYIFNFNQPAGGFVIVSADDVTFPILGYCFDQNYGLQNHPPQFDDMLESFRKQIIYAKENQILAAKKIQAEWDRLKVKTANFEKGKDNGEVGPLLATTWNQNWPYNELCPADAGGPGGHAYAGCVATAMAQVMKYWSNPVQGTGSHGYTHYNYGYLFADFEATTYDWANMPHSISSSNIPVATLLYHCGVAVEMNYGPSGSGANLDGYHGACNAFKNYFNYDLSAYHDNKYQYEDSTWHNMIRNELDNGRPMVYAGWDGWSGHAFNLDGYEVVGDLYHYHFNWGWSGSYNGYYYLDDLTPGYHNFTSGQEAIFNLYPYAANLISCYPQNSNYWTGTTNLTAKTETSLVFGTDPEDGWMSFDISAIPDGSVIYAVSFNGYVYERYKPNWSITPVTSDPVTSGAGVLHADIVAEQSSGYYFHQDESIVNYPVDWRTYMLEGDVCADLQSSLPSDKFTVGIANDYSSYTRYIRFHGWNEANPPYLNIYYTAFGNIEGYVTEYGTKAPIENVFVTIRNFTDTTDASGYYFFENVPIGTYDVFADANNNSNSNGNPYFDHTESNVSIPDGITTQLDIGLKWAEIELTPASINVMVDPDEVVQEDFTIINDGTGELDYYCHVSAPRGDILVDIDIETASGDMTLYGCEYDGTHIWATGPVASGGDHQLYKFDKNGNLLDSYSQGTTSSWGMKKMTFDGTYLYSTDPNGFYRINPDDGNIETLFTDFPDGLYGGYGLAWVPSLGFVASWQDEDFFVFDTTGTLLGRLYNPGIHCMDITWDTFNNCLWLAYSIGSKYHQYDIITENLMGLTYSIPLLDGLSNQSALAACFATDLVDGKVTLCGMVNGNPVNRFFALELETWLQIENNKYGTVPGSAKGSLDVTLQMEASDMTVQSKTADIVISHNAGENDTLPVTITNNYTHGSLSGYVTEYSTGNPIQNATVTINTQSDITDINGYYSISNIPVGEYEAITSSPDYIDDTTYNVPVTGLPHQLDIELKWTEIDVNPVSYNINLSPDNTLVTSMNISNTGTGDLLYDCEIVFQDKSKSPTILVVDRDMSCWNSGPDDYADEWPNFQNALNTNGFTYTYHEVYYPWWDGPDLATMQQYDIIIWFAGELYSSDCMTTNDEYNLAGYLDGGGNLLLSSQGYLTKYGWGNITFNPGEFPYDYLGLRTVYTSNWVIWFMGTIEGVPGSLAEGYILDLMYIYYMVPLELTEIIDHVGIDLFNVTDPSPEGICANQYEGSGFKSVYTSASLASIADDTERANLLAEIISWFEGQWLFITSNESGTVPGEMKGSVDVGLLFDATGLTEDTYEAEINVNSNDPDSLIAIPVTLNVVSGSNVDLKVFLEGPFNVSDMNVDLNNDGLLPLSQPYNVYPWYYTGNEDVTSIPNSDIVDWVLVEYRDAPDVASATSVTMITRQAAFLLNNGSIVGLDGSSYLQFYNSIIQQLFVVVWHRNHLGILSANPLMETDGTYSYDFTTDSSKVYGGETGYNEIASGIWGMVGSDGNADGDINNADKNNIWTMQAGMSGYKPGDYNMDCNVNNIDKNDVWVPNIEKGTQVPN
ncbi:MAG: C10 family peptidase [Bacteroidales bacterium]|nr:C10 family peptidase [Bacteroidales bacterium]